VSRHSARVLLLVAAICSLGYALLCLHVSALDGGEALGARGDLAARRTKAAGAVLAGEQLDWPAARDSGAVAVGEVGRERRALPAAAAAAQAAAAAAAAESAALDDSTSTRDAAPDEDDATLAATPPLPSHRIVDEQVGRIVIAGRLGGTGTPSGQTDKPHGTPVPQSPRRPTERGTRVYPPPPEESNFDYAPEAANFEMRTATRDNQQPAVELRARRTAELTPTQAPPLMPTSTMQAAAATFYAGAATTPPWTVDGELNTTKRNCLVPPSSWQLTRIARSQVPSDSPLAVYHNVLRGTACVALADTPDSAHRIVIATQSSPDRLEQLAVMAARWRGCISVAVSICRGNEWVNLLKLRSETPVSAGTGRRWWPLQLPQ
jgi:hypothetical protein